MSANSTRKRSRRKSSDRPEKPYPEFPLYAHPLGYWSKKIAKRIHHFGRWGKTVDGVIEHLPYEASWKAAYAAFKARVDDAQAGRIAEYVVSADKPVDEVLTIGGLGNRFLNAKLRQLESDELAPRSFYEYKQATDLLVATFGKTRLVSDLVAGDFESLRADMSKRWGPLRLGKFVQLIRTVFRYAADNGLVDKPVRFGTGFNKPGKATLRKHKAASAKKLFTANEIRMILDALAGREIAIDSAKKSGRPVTIKLGPNPQLHAAVLLAINAGLGNTDIACLQHSHVDLQSGSLDFPRSKTGLPRRAPLWRETIAAIQAAAKRRPKPKSDSDAGCVFLNRAGRRWVQSTTTSASDYVSTQFRQALRKLKINGRKGLGFYSLRHTFATVGLQAGDRDAVKAIMGHASHDVLAAYDETGPNDDRLRAVTDRVRNWLFGETAVK
jgi:integrase